MNAGAEKGHPESLGLVCPRCRSTDFTIGKTERQSGSVKRRRVCSGCGRVSYSREIWDREANEKSYVDAKLSRLATGIQTCFEQAGISITSSGIARKRRQNGTPTTSSHTDEDDMKTLNVPNRRLEAALCQASKLPNIEKHFDDETLQDAHDHYHSRIRLRQFLTECAKKNGDWQNDGFRVDQQTMRFAFGQIQASGLSNIDAGGILSNVANKHLEAGWGMGDMAWREVCRIRPVVDLKETTSYRMGADLKYERVGPDGQIKHGTLSETAYGNRAETFAKMAALTRQDIINDDMSAFTSVQFELGIGAIDAFNEIFWTEFLDNSSFFSIGHMNVSTGAGSALSITGLQAGEAVFMKQTKPNGQPLAVRPEILLVPEELRPPGDSLMTSEKIVTGESKTLGDANTYRNKFRVVSSPYMSNTNYTGYSATAWYLLANVVRMAVIETVFLNGQEQPVIESADSDFNVLGVQFRGYHDFGVRKQEYRGGVRSAGS